MTTVTTQQAETVLALVAEWLGRKGLGTPHCPEGRALDDYVQHTDDGSPCLTATFGPAPTGKDAAWNALGPQLVMDWDWSGTPTPTILLEGGPYEWAYDCSFWVQEQLHTMGLRLYVEPYACYALSIYPG